MMATRILFLWTALLAITTSSAAVARRDLNRNALDGRGAPLNGNYSTSATSVQLTTTTIYGPDGTAGSNPNRALGAPPNDGGTITDNESSTAPLNTTSGNGSLPTLTLTSRSSNNTIGQPGSVTFTPQPVPIPSSSPAYPSQPATSEPCTPLPPGEPMTVWLVVYTSTVTFNGSLEDYTPPYPTLAVPTYCEEPTTSAPGFFPTTDVAFPPQPGTQSFGPGLPTKPGKSDNRPFPTVDHSSAILRPWPSNIDGGQEVGGDPGGGGDDEPTPPRRTITFITTDRNPAVATRSARPPPGFTQSWQHKGGPAGGNGQHNSMLAGDSQRLGSMPSFTVIADRSQVIINSQTFSNLQPDQTSTVTVDQGTFTIAPTAVTGHGQTIKKPAPVPTGGPVSQAPAKEINVIGGKALTAIGSTVMVLNYTTYTYGVGITESSVVVDGDTISLGPSGITVHSTTLGGPAATGGMTKFELVGGATITEIYPSTVIIEGDVITLAPDMERRTTVVNGQTLTVGPEGVTYSSITIPMAGAAVTTTFRPTVTWDSEIPRKTGSSEGPTDEDVSEDDNRNDGEDDEEGAGFFVRPDFAFLGLAAGIAIGVLETF